MKFTLLQPIGIDTAKLNELTEKLSNKGYDTEVIKDIPTTEGELIEKLKDTEILMLVNFELRKNTLEKLPSLKMISIAFTAFDQVDIEYCKENNIIISNSAGYSTNSVAELTLGHMISLSRHMKVSDNLTREGKDKGVFLGTELFGKTIGILGTGTIGLRVAKFVKAFGCKILGYSRTQREEAKKLGIKYVELDELLSQSDFVTLHTPLNEDTRGLINADNISLMKESAYLINTARGDIVDKNALYDALSNRKIAGAGLDVFDIEPPLNKDNPLLSLDNVSLTPHIAYFTKEALELRADIAFNNIYKWLDGEPQNVVS